MTVIDDIIRNITKLEKRVGRLEFRSFPQWIYLTTPLTSVSWDGDNYSTTAVTVIDLSAVFGVPAKVKAVDLQIEAEDPVNAPSNVPYFAVGPSATYYYAVTVYPIGSGLYNANHGVCPCDANGDIYFRIIASGANTMACWIRIWGYEI